MKIAIVNSSSFGKYFNKHIETLEKIGDVSYFTFKSDECDDVLIDALNNFEYIISSVTPNFTRRFFENCPKLKIISRHGIGYNNIDIQAANDHRVYVTKVDADVEKDAVAENAIALLMALSRRVIEANVAAKTGNWAKRAEFMGYQLQGKTAGIIGFGNIGSRVASILKNGFNMKVYAYDPNIDIPVKNKINDIEFVDLDTLVARADFISLNAYLDEKSYHMIDQLIIEKMKPQTLIVNTARGALVDDSEIIKAVKERRIEGYATDVVENEPIDETHNLFTHERIVVTPHTSAYTWECLESMGDKCVDDIVKVHYGELPKGLVTNF